jgi:hypothetical protein
MRLTAGQLNRATLARQLLLERADVPVAEAVRRVVTIQAQDPASPYLSLWARVAGLDAAAVDAAYDDRSIVRAQLMRVTLQTVAAADHAAFHGAMVPSLRGSRLNDPRFTGTTGMTAADADALLPELLAFVAEPRTGAAIEAWLEARVGRPVPRAWWAFRTFAPLVHTRGGGPWFHGPKVSVEAAPAGTAVVGDPAAAAQVLVRRYLEGFGPASARDVAQFSILRQPVVRAALDGLAGELVTYEGPDGRVLHDVPGGAIPDAGTPAPPRLLPMWETSLLAYAARWSSGATATCCPRSWSTGGWAACGAWSTARSRSRRSTACPAARGPTWPPRPPRCSRSSATGTPPCTGGTGTGGAT